MPQLVRTDTKRWITGKNERSETKNFSIKAIDHIDLMLLLCCHIQFCKLQLWTRLNMTTVSVLFPTDCAYVELIELTSQDT